MRCGENVWALVLAAGDGTRLKSLTMTATGLHVPKQFCSLRGGPSLLREALSRAQAIAPRKRICTIVASDHHNWWEEPLGSLPRSNVIVQPMNRGTANGILLPLLHVLERDAGAQVVLMPSDHHVQSETTLALSLRRAVGRLARFPDDVLLLGIEAEEPDPQLGYIVPGAGGDDGALPIARFVEKPSLANARALIVEGALWNSFIVAATARALLTLLERHFPDIVGEMRRVVRDAGTNQVHEGNLAELYGRLPSLDFSHHVLENGRSDNLRVIRVPACGWSDLGTPERVAETLRRMSRHLHPTETWLGESAQICLAERHEHMTSANWGF